MSRAEEVYGPAENGDLLREILVSTLRLMRDAPPRGDLKLVNSALKDLRHAFRVFAPYSHVRKVAVWAWWPRLFRPASRPRSQSRPRPR